MSTNLHGIETIDANFTSDPIAIGRAGSIQLVWTGSTSSLVAVIKLYAGNINDIDKAEQVEWQDGLYSSADEISIASDDGSIVIELPGAGFLWIVVTFTSGEGDVEWAAGGVRR